MTLPKRKRNKICIMCGKRKKRENSFFCEVCAKEDIFIKIKALRESQEYKDGWMNTGQKMHYGKLHEYQNLKEDETLL